MPSGRVKGDKYKKKFAKLLKDGLCRDGLSIEECCHMWGITRDTYYSWRDGDKHPEFKEAAEYAKRDRICYWNKLFRDVASGKVKGNAGTLCFAMKNIEGIGYQDKVEVTNTGQDKITTINLSVLPAPAKRIDNILEHDES